jgi:hypothetical protein
MKENVAHRRVPNNKQSTGDKKYWKIHENGKIKSVKHSPCRKLLQNRMTN